MAQTAKKKVPKWDTPGDLARHCMEKSENDLDAAATLMEEALTGDTWDALAGDIISHACRDLCQDARYYRRQELSPFRPDAAKGFEDAARRAAASAERNLYLFPLSSGKLLGQATKEDVLAEQGSYADRARQNAAYARWYELIAAEMKAKGTVSAQLTPGRLQELADENGVSG